MFVIEFFFIFAGGWQYNRKGELSLLQFCRKEKFWSLAGLLLMEYLVKNHIRLFGLLQIMANIK